MKALSLILISLLPSILSPQGFEMINPSVVDARSVALGRTAILSSINSTAMFSNPGALAMLPTRQGQLGGRMLMGSSDIEWANDYYDNYSRIQTPQLSINHFAIATPYSFAGSDLNLTFGIGFRTYFDLDVNTENKRSIDGTKWSSEGTTRGGLKMLTPALAINIDDQYFFGVTYNSSISGTIEENWKYKDPDGSVDKDKTESDHSAKFLQFGGIARLSPQLTVGFMLRPSFAWEFTESRYTDEDGIETTDETDFDYTIPGIFGLGVSMQTSPSRLITVEYQTRKYSEFEIDGEPIQDIDDGASFRIGFERQGITAWRFGFFSDDQMLTDEDDEKPKPLMGITWGFGSKLGTMQLDAFVEYSTVGREYQYQKSGDSDYSTLTDTYSTFRVGFSLSSEF